MSWTLLDGVQVLPVSPEMNHKGTGLYLAGDLPDTPLPEEIHLVLRPVHRDPVLLLDLPCYWVHQGIGFICLLVGHSQALPILRVPAPECG